MMSGLLTGVFGDAGRSADDTEQTGARDEAGFGAGFGADHELAVSAGQTVEVDDMNGGSHSVANEQDVTLDVGAHAILSVAADTMQGAFTGDGFDE